MSNFVCIGLCILISFVTSACFMSVYKEEFKTEYNSDKNLLYSRISNNIKEIDILRARIIDLESENELKEMEKLDDGK